MSDAKQNTLAQYAPFRVVGKRLVDNEGEMWAEFREIPGAVSFIHDETEFLQEICDKWNERACT